MIAAGEVVERPASVVKELVENSLDAGATAITGEVEEGGRKLVRVSDNGSGMSREDALMAVERHTTSKISGPDDLAAIATLGFRGEALASIGAVSALELVTRSADDASATEVLVENARVVHAGAAGRPIGTTVTVRHLFSGVPARWKQMKPAKAELIRVIESVTRLALARPDVHFRLLSDRREVINAPATDDERANVGHVMGADVARDMVVVEHEGDVRIRGLVGRPSVERATSRHQHFFVNGRWVRSRELSDALAEGYRPRTMVGRFPPAVVHVDVPFGDVDVNVHPQKLEVRFLREDVCDVLTRSVRWALQREFPVPELATEVAEQHALWKADAPAGEGARPEAAPAAPRRPAGAVARTSPDTRRAAAAGMRPLSEAGTRKVPGGKLPSLRILGQARASFIVAEGPDGIYIIDQHAAAERINLETLRGRDFGVQELIEPAYVELQPREAEALRSLTGEFGELGFRVEEFGDGFLVRAVPALVNVPEPGVALRAILEDLHERRGPVSRSALDGVLESMACHMSIRAGDPMTMDAMADLVRRLGRLEEPGVCAHGRPTLMRLGFGALEKRFGRLG